MIELDSVFCVKYKERHAPADTVQYGILIDEDENFFYLTQSKYEMLNKKHYHYQRITGEEYLDAISNIREISGDERNS